jgi:hypothetical protein
LFLLVAKYILVFETPFGAHFNRKVLLVCVIFVQTFKGICLRTKSEICPSSLGAGKCLVGSLLSHC